MTFQDPIKSVIETGVISPESKDALYRMEKVSALLSTAARAIDALFGTIAATAVTVSMLSRDEMEALSAMNKTVEQVEANVKLALDEMLQQIKQEMGVDEK